MTTIDRSAVIFGNELDAGDYRSAVRNKEGYVRKFGDDTALPYPLRSEPAPVIGEILGVRRLVSAGKAKGPGPIAGERPIIVGTIRMGFGHYRIAMAMASAAHALGYTPYWMDLMSFPDTTCTKIISAQNDLYSMGSRISQKSRLFNTAVWEPMNYEGFRRLSYNASDQKASELMVRPFNGLPKDVPFVGCHSWPSQAAVHAGMERVVNAIPDNWPMALHLAEGAIHTVQTPNAFTGYKMLRGFEKGKVLRPMPAESLVYTGHYADHELVANVEADCEARIARRQDGEPVRLLLTVGGAGAQQDLFRSIIRHVEKLVQAGKATLWINVGDHKDVWKSLAQEIPALGEATMHVDDFAEVAQFAEEALTGHAEGIHGFGFDDIFAAVYSTNVLMRASDAIITKPSELAFYPVPKVMIQRVGGHERWGAVRAAEVGDGTYELDSVKEICGCLDFMCESPELIVEMCEHIVVAKAAGIYDGAYNVIKLALGI